jgi:hypothetical protein
MGLSSSVLETASMPSSSVDVSKVLQMDVQKLLFATAVLGAFLWFVILAIWNRTKTGARRRRALRSFGQNPVATILVIVQVVALVLFLLGLVVPRIGGIEVLNSGLKLWQTAGLVALLASLISPLIDAKLR